MPFHNIRVILSANAGNFRGVLASSAGQVKAFERTVESAGATTNRVGAGMRTAMAGGAAAVAAGLGYAVVKAAEFDASMRNVNSLTGLSQKAFEAQEKQVVAMSTQLPQSAKQLADGLYQIASSGFTGAKGLTVLKASAVAASAGLTDTNTSAQAIVAVLHSYGEGVGQAKAVSDTLFQTVNLGVLSFQDMAQGLGQVVGVAANAGVSLRTVGAAIATMTRSGLVPAESFVSLNQLITHLLKPSSALADAYHQLGYESGESALRQRGLAGVMKDLNTVTHGSTAAWLRLFPNVQAARGAFALASHDGRLMNQMMRQMGDDAGMTGKVLREQSKSASFQFTLLKNDVTAAAIAIGTRMLPVLVSIAKGIQNFVKSAASATGSLHPLWAAIGQVAHNLIQLAGGIATAVGPLAKLAVGGVVASFTALAQALAFVTRVAKDHIDAVLAIGSAYAAVRIGSFVSGLMTAQITAGASATAFTNLVTAVRKAQFAMGVASLSGAGSFAKLGAGIEGFIGKPGMFAGMASSWKGYTASVRGATGALGKLGATAAPAVSALAKLGPALGVGLVVAAGLAWQDFESKMRDAANEAVASGEKIRQATNFFDPKSTQQALAQMRGVVSKVQGEVSHLGIWDQIGAGISGIIHGKFIPGDLAGEAASITGSLLKPVGAADQQMQALERTIRAYQAAARQGAATTDMSATAFGKLANTAGVSNALIIAASGHFAGYNKQAILTQAGVTSVAQAQFKLNNAVNSQKGSLAGATPAMQALKTGISQLGDASATAADKAKSLDDALKGLLSPEVDLSTAVADWQSALQKLGDAAQHVHATIDPLTGSISAATPAGAKLLEAWNAAVTGMQKSLSGMAEVGRPVSDMNKIVNRSVDAMIKAGRAAGLTEPQIRGLLQTYHLTPKEIRTLIKTYGIQAAEQQVKQHRKTLGSLPEQINTRITTPGAIASKDDLNRLLHASGLLPKNKSITMSIPGGVLSRKRLEDILHAAGLLPKNKHLPVDTPNAIRSRKQLEDVLHAAGILPKSKHIPTSVPGAVLSRKQLEDVLHAAGVLPKNKHIPTTTPGAITSRKQLEDVLHAAGVLPKSKHIPTNIPGGITSRKQLEDILHAANVLPKSKHIPVSAPGADTVKNQIQAIQDHINSLPRSKRITIDAVGNVRMAGYGIGERKYGGPIDGIGGPTQDNQLRRLSVGEYVIREREASKQGHMLDELNAGRAKIVPMAGGGSIPITVQTRSERLNQVRDMDKGIMSRENAGLKKRLLQQFQEMFAGGGGAAASSTQVRSWIATALNIMHMSMAFLPGIASLIQNESGGNPRAINNYDANAKRGDPSRGLMQTIMSTFQAYVLPALRGLGIYNPIANITAGVRYALANYGPGMLLGGGNHSPGGGYRPYAKGGFRNFIGRVFKPPYGPTLPREAGVAPDGADLVQWGEKGTGGEAYIPLAKDRRQGAMHVLAGVAKEFGLKLSRYALGGWNGPVSGFAGIERTKTGTPYVGSRSLSQEQAISAVEQAYETAKKPLSWIGYEKGLQLSIDLTSRWSRELQRIASVAGVGVADKLAQMGDAGVNIVHRMAQGTKSQLGAMAQSFMQLANNAGSALQTYTLTLMATNNKTKQFNADILTLIKRGQVNLAAQLQAGGLDDANAARRAVANIAGARVAEKAATNAPSIDENLTKALQLVTIMGQSKKPLGFTGLANASGMSVGDVWQLWSRYYGPVFSHLTGTGKLQAIGMDQALARAGKPLTGMRYGAIVPASRTGLYYAEPGSGGESFIPHHGDMQRNRQLWRETGRIIGASAGTTMVRSTIVSPGAVSVKLNFNGSNVSAAEMQRIADRTASNALDSLVKRINAG
jgi:TP901 family phage tail tape measure protein